MKRIGRIIRDRDDSAREERMKDGNAHGTPPSLQAVPLSHLLREGASLSRSDPFHPPDPLDPHKPMP
jgi:hypothetical protein